MSLHALLFYFLWNMIYLDVRDLFPCQIQVEIFS